jgi:putative lipoic acid-binding regulatory protein
MDDSLLEFPCHIDVKVMGRAEQDFTELVVELVRQHVPEINDGAVRTRASRNGNYIAVTIRVFAESRSQMDALYRELSAHEKIAMAL